MVLDAGYNPALPEYKTGVLPNELIQHNKSNNVVAMTEFHGDFTDMRSAVVTRNLESHVRPSYNGKYPLRIILFSRLSFAWRISYLPLYYLLAFLCQPRPVQPFSWRNCR